MIAHVCDIYAMLVLRKHSIAKTACVLYRIVVEDMQFDAPDKAHSDCTMFKTVQHYNIDLKSTTSEMQKPRSPGHPGD
jgi:hypothetical protein